MNCDHKWIPVGPIWKFGIKIKEKVFVLEGKGMKVCYKENFFKQGFMCCKCGAEKEESPYKAIGRKDFNLTEEEFNRLKLEAEKVDELLMNEI